MNIDWSKYTRCPRCFLLVCRCNTEEYEIREEQQTVAPDRIAAALWN